MSGNTCSVVGRGELFSSTWPIELTGRSSRKSDGSMWMACVLCFLWGLTKFSRFTDGHWTVIHLGLRREEQNLDCLPRLFTVQPASRSCNSLLHSSFLSCWICCNLLAWSLSLTCLKLKHKGKINRWFWVCAWHPHYLNIKLWMYFSRASHKGWAYNWYLQELQ